MCIRDRLEVGRELCYVDVGNGNASAQTVDQKDKQRKEDLLAKLRDLPVSYTHLDVYKRQP